MTYIFINSAITLALMAAAYTLGASNTSETSETSETPNTKKDQK